ncbi:MAG: Tar ligand binding domain-containing protein [Ignavibacteria bacterium]
MQTPIPLTQRERVVPPGEILVSRTDLRGSITYANSVFAGVSGYTQEELIGHGHSIVRHPDMPGAVFADMWKSLQRGHMWHGVVKNRCKNGDHYWVDALIVPLTEEGRVNGYLSVRRQARRADVEAAERHYAALRRGETRTAKPRRFRLDRYLSIRSGVLLGIAFVTLMMVVGAAVGLGTISRAERELGSMYRERVQAGHELSRIQFLMSDSRARLMAVSGDGAGDPAPQRVADARREADALWRSFRGRAAAGRMAELADGFDKARQRYVADGLAPAEAALALGDAAAMRNILRQSEPAYEAANGRADELSARMVAEAGEQYSAERELHETVQYVVVAGIACVLVVLSVSGLFFFRGVVRPVEARIRDLENMAEGKLDAHVDVEGGGEIGKLNRAFAATQAKLQYLLDNSFRGATQISAESAQLKDLVLRIGDGIEDQHERVFRVLDRINECAEGIGGVLPPAERLLAAAERLARAAATTCGDAGEGEAESAEMLADARWLAASLRITSFTTDEMEREMKHVADFLVDDREAMHAMWNATAHLATTANSLEKAAGWFEIG